MDKAKQDNIINKLKEKGIKEKCPVCEQSHFTLIDQFVTLQLNDKLDGSVKVGGPMIPAVAIVCNNCGFIMQHATKALEL